MQHMPHREKQDGVRSGAQKVLLATDEYDFSEIEGMEALCGPLQTYFSRRLAIDEWESFKFCLHRLLHSIDMLYRVMLPELVAYTTQEVEQVSESAMLRKRQCIWTCLREIVRLLEQIEPVCQLITDLTYRMLEALDSDDSALSMREASSKGANEKGWQQPFRQEEWERGYTVLLYLLDAWQKYQDRCQAFITHFVVLIDDIPGLAQVDSNLDLLLDHACAIFGDILPDFHSDSIASDEAVAALLLNMMQKVDLLLWQIDILLEPLYPLVKHYAIGARLQ